MTFFAGDCNNEITSPTNSSLDLTLLKVSIKSPPTKIAESI
jgi:hypothetical protein